MATLTGKQLNFKPEVKRSERIDKQTPIPHPNPSFPNTVMGMRKCAKISENVCQNDSLSVNFKGLRQL